MLIWTESLLQFPVSQIQNPVPWLPIGGGWEHAIGRDVPAEDNDSQRNSSILSELGITHLSVRGFPKKTILKEKKKEEIKEISVLIEIKLESCGKHETWLINIFLANYS